MSNYAMKLALEALKELVAQTEGRYFCMKHDHVALQNARFAIARLREALAEQPAQQEPVACKTLCELCVKRGYIFCANAAQTTPIPSPPAQQEPVAWRTYTGRGYYIIDATLEEAQKNWPDRQHQPLYTSPPAKRTWIGLSDEEMDVAMDYWSERERSAYGGAHAADAEYVSMIDTWRYIESKLREKNQ